MIGNDDRHVVSLYKRSVTIIELYYLIRFNLI